MVELQENLALSDAELEGLKGYEFKYKKGELTKHIERLKKACANLKKGAVTVGRTERSLQADVLATLLIIYTHSILLPKYFDELQNLSSSFKSINHSQIPKLLCEKYWNGKGAKIAYRNGQAVRVLLALDISFVPVRSIEKQLKVDGGIKNMVSKHKSLLVGSQDRIIIWPGAIDVRYSPDRIKEWSDLIGRSTKQINLKLTFDKIVEGKPQYKVKKIYKPAPPPYVIGKIATRQILI